VPSREALGGVTTREQSVFIGKLEDFGVGIASRIPALDMRSK
jgi:hypothetical protein